MSGLVTFRTVCAATWSRLNRQISIGITGRLSLSFAAVAILAAAANLIAEHGVAVIRSTYPEQTVVGPLVAPPQAAPVLVPVMAPPTPQLAPADPAPLLEAAERFERAVDVRASMDSAPARSEMQAALKNLESSSKTFRAALEQRSERNASIAPRIKSVEATGGDLIQNADARRAALEDYSARADGIERRLTSSVDRAWKIFGRVLARQSLMQLHSQFEEIRHGFARFSGSSGDQAAAGDAVTANEAAFAKTLDGNAAAFTRSEGDAWVKQLRTDFANLVELRQSVVTFDMSAHDDSAAFENARDRLVESIPKTTAVSAARTRTPGRMLKAAPAIKAAVSGSMAPAAGTAGPAAAAPTDAVSLAPVPTNAAQADQPPHVAPPLASPVLETVTTTGGDGHERRTVAWISGAVLAILMLISILTVRSILGPVGRMLQATEQIANGDVDVRVPGGGIKELDILGVSFNRMAGQLAAARDMTRDYQQRLEEKVEQRTRQLQDLAEHDPLTHLPNRRQLFVLLNHALERAAQSRRHVAVFFMDIDNFKNMNDSLGHAFGDRVLTGIAQRLKETAQSFGFAGRLGGDEFTVVYEDAASEAVLTDAGRQLVEIFDRPLNIDGREVVVRASVGASLYPNHGDRAEDLLSAADVALFRAKALGRSQLAIFTPELLQTATRKFTIEQGLRRAIEHNEFELVFQPEVSVDSLEMVLVESLVRWRMPDGRQAPPGEFLAVTEESGLIVEVGNWVLRKAIETASHWHHGEWPQARVAINVSPRQLLDPRFVENVLDLLREFNLPPRCIEVELTESVLQSGPMTIETLRTLRSADIAIALDDFGTGYSSLASLENLPLTRIKLDRSLIASIDTNPRSAAVATAIIGLCKALGLDMTAEGIERPEQFTALAAHRAIHLQGYLISRPIAADAVVNAKRMIPAIMQDLLLAASAARSPQLKACMETTPMASGFATG
jgi:diguanylate cyclase (GGDEF)-like protein